MKEQTQRLAVSRSALASLALAIVALTIMLASGLGNRLGLWHFRTALEIFRSSAFVGMAAVLLSIVGLLRVVPRGSRRGFRPAAAAFALGLLVVAVPLSWLARAKQVPAIHDISTDTEDPPKFQAILPLRRDATNPAEYGGPEVARLQHQAYPDLRPLDVNVPPPKAFAAALDAARAMNFEIVDSNPSSGRIEATATTLWFGFKDDIVVRVRPLANGKESRIDVRSLSRVGKGDLGTNARRIWKYLNRIKEKLNLDQ
jgi:uncharacterized protein (DUF1499 family)